MTAIGCCAAAAGVVGRPSSGPATSVGVADGVGVADAAGNGETEAATDALGEADGLLVADGAADAAAAGAVAGGDCRKTAAATTARVRTRSPPARVTGARNRLMAPRPGVADWSASALPCPLDGAGDRSVTDVRRRRAGGYTRLASRFRRTRPAVTAWCPGRDSLSGID